jgi:hypothetical protein
MAVACVLGIFLGDEEQELKLQDIVLQTKTKVARERPRRNTAKSTDFWSVDSMGRI